MRRRRKIIMTALLLAVIVVFYFFIPTIRQKANPDLVPAYSADPISFAQEEDLHFFPEGLVICGSPSRFYDLDGTDILPPFKQDDLSAENGNIDIIAHTENYIATASNRIYNTQTVPFSMVYENKDIHLWDMKEYSDFLLLLIQNEESVVEPFVLVKGSDFLISLDGIGDSKYISADSSRGGKDLSLLTMSLDAPVPFPRVFHYVNRNELYGVLSLEDQFLYNIFRLKSAIVLIGINNILCYNIDGKLLWSVKNDSNGLFDAIPEKNGLLLYFPEITHIGEDKGNCLFVQNNGDRSVKEFPKYLSNLRTYRNGYIGLEYKKTLVFLNKNGRTTKKQKLPDPVNTLEVDPYKPENLYVRTDSNTLQLYTTEKQEEDEE